MMVLLFVATLMKVMVISISHDCIPRGWRPLVVLMAMWRTSRGRRRWIVERTCGHWKGWLGLERAVCGTCAQGGGWCICRGQIWKCAVEWLRRAGTTTGIGEGKLC